MTYLLWLLFILSLVQCMTSEILLVESGPGIVKPSETLEMTCTVTGASLTDGTNMYCVEFILKSERKHLVWLGRICYDATTYYASSLQGRLTLTRDTNKGKVFLKLTGMKPEESGTYYCARETHRGWFDKWSPGSFVTVTSGEKLTPLVLPLSSYGENKNSDITMGCLSKNYFPNSLSVKFSRSIGPVESTAYNNVFPLSGNPPTYTMVSYITVPSSEWEINSYKCEVTHDSTTIVKDIPKGNTSNPEKPSVNILQGSCSENINDEVELTCQASNLISQDATIKWFINDQQKSLPQDIVHQGTSNNLYSLHAKMSISRAQWNNGVPVKCLVTDSKTGKSNEATARKCSDTINCLGIDMYMLPPRTEDLLLKDAVYVSCVANNMKETTGAEFSFEFPGKSSQMDVTQEDTVMNANGTFRLSALLRIETETWNSGIEITCIFNCPGIAEPMITRIAKITDTNEMMPNIMVFPPPAEDIAKNELCTITCIAHSYRPKDIFIMWTQNDNEVSRDRYVNSESKPFIKNGYSATSLLSIPCNEWNDGARCACLVGHPTIPNNFIRKIIDKSSGNAPKVNVTVITSEATMSCH